MAQWALSTAETQTRLENMLTLMSDWMFHFIVILKYSARQEQNAYSTHLDIPVIRDKVTIESQPSLILYLRMQWELFWVILGKKKKTFEVVNLLLDPDSSILISFHVSIAREATCPYQHRPLDVFYHRAALWKTPKWFSCEGPTYISFSRMAGSQQ